MRLAAICSIAAGLVAGGCVGLQAQAAPAYVSQSAPVGSLGVAASPESAVGGRLHGVVKSGSVPLPGVTVTAQNTLTGKKYSTTTDTKGMWALIIPQNGRYVIRTQFAAFAVGSQEAVLNAASHDQAVSFDLMLASRALAQTQSAAGLDAAGAQAIQQLALPGAQSLSLASALAGDTETQAGPTGTGAGAALPSIAGNSDFGGDSVAITGQSGQVSALAGVDVDRIRDAMETAREQGALPGAQAGLFGGGGPGTGGGGFGGSGGGFGGGGGGFGGGGGGFGGPGGGGGGRGNFRGFNPGQPHGAIFWMGSNSALNAEPFSLQGQSQDQPESGSNRFGITFMTAPYIPKLTKPSGKDNVFLTLSGTRTSSPEDEYGNVPTDAERGGNFAGMQAIYDPTTGQPFNSDGAANVIPGARISPQALALLKYFPEPNLTGGTQNYHLLTTQQSNTTLAGARYTRSLGAGSLQQGGRRGGGGGGRRNQNQGLRQSINVNYNWAHAASDNIDLFPQLGGKTASDSNSVQAGYTVGYHKVTSIFTAGWNRSNTNTTNYFTNSDNVAGDNGILGPDGAPLNASPLNYGLPNVTLSDLAGLNEQQPNFSVAQTISLSEVLSWIRGKHNLRFGGDYRRVHRDFLGGSNATGSFVFTGLFTEAPGTNEASSATPATGSPFADFLLGLPQSTSINSSDSKSYLRDNAWDGFATDDWRVLPSLTLQYGMRYEFYAPYSEKYGRLGEVETNPDAAFTNVAQVQAGSAGTYYGKLPDSLVFPFKTAFAPRLGLALRLPKQTVVRAGFGMNFSIGEYAVFAQTMAHQPPFANVQTNEVALNTSGGGAPACAQTIPSTCYTLANGFPAPDPVGSYALDPHYAMPYVEVWNLDVQKTLPWGVVLNVGYNGSKGNHLDITSAPRATPNNPLTNPTNLVFTYDRAAAFSKFTAGTVRVNKRLSSGIALGGNYQYGHSIDDASSVGGPATVATAGTTGTSTRVAQNWQDLNAEEGNSSFDIRHRVTGTYVYELPFGKDKFWLTTGTASHILEGFSVSGSYTIATGTPLTPSYTASATNVSCGTAGSGRPDRVGGVSLTSGGGSENEWFNPGAFTTPTAVSGYPCAVFGNAARNSIAGPGTIQNNLSLSKTMQLGDTRSMEIRATANNAFNTVQYSGVGTSVTLPTFGQVTSVAAMRSFSFLARFRF